MAGEQGYANPAAIVSTQWVADHLNDPNVRLIEVDVAHRPRREDEDEPIERIDLARACVWRQRLLDPSDRLDVATAPRFRPRRVSAGAVVAPNGSSTSITHGRGSPSTRRSPPRLWTLSGLARSWCDMMTRTASTCCRCWWPQTEPSLPSATTIVVYVPTS